MKVYKFINASINKLRWKIKSQFLSRSNVKYFCIGLNKTGTTSVKRAFIDLGFIVGNQREAEKLDKEYYAKDFEPILRYCFTGEVFQDFPFSCPETYKKVNSEFPDCRFILTVRNSSEQWVKSLRRYHSFKFGKGELPTYERLNEANYVRKGWIWDFMHKVYGVTERDPYNVEVLSKFYDEYNQSIVNYFSNNDRFLKINVADPCSYETFCSFLNKEPIYHEFPWLNKTERKESKRSEFMFE